MRNRSRLLVLACIAVLTTACGSFPFGNTNTPSTPRLGRWTITALTGTMHWVDSGAACQGNWTFNPDVTSTWNGVNVMPGGEVEYFLGFHGVPGSPEPDSYNTAGHATATSGNVVGDNTRADLGTHETATGSFDSQQMTVAWTDEQHVGMASGCKTDVVGSGTFTAKPP